MRNLREEVEIYLRNLWTRIGIDAPANHNHIVEFIKEDVEAAADPINYHSGDMDIAFRRFLEKDLEM